MAEIIAIHEKRAELNLQRAMTAVEPEAPRIRGTESFIRTFSGRRFWPLDPRPEEIFIEDVAHALSLTCRFTGHCRRHYSVAQHSVHVSHLAEHEIAAMGSKPEHVELTRETALWGLLHDASEAYLCDLPSPIKRAPGLGRLYKQYEQRLMAAVIERFNLLPHEPSIVIDADARLLATEMRDLMRVPAAVAGEWNAASAPRLECTIDPIKPVTAELAFLGRFNELMDRRQEAGRACES